MNKTLKTILIILGIFTAVGGALAATYFYLQKSLKQIVFNTTNPESAFIGAEEKNEE